MTEGTIAGVEPLCSICGGTRAEHEGRVHAFTEQPGQLETQAQQKKRQEALAGSGPLAIKVPGGSDNLMVTRLIEVLLEKGVLNAPDALYITGVGSKPAPPSGFQDPSSHPFYQPTPGAGY